MYRVIAPVLTVLAGSRFPDFGFTLPLPAVPVCVCVKLFSPALVPNYNAEKIKAEHALNTCLSPQCFVTSSHKIYS